MLDSIGTDHCPFKFEQKKLGLGDFTKIQNGAAGIEDRLLILHTYGVLGRHFDLCRMVELGSAAPARISPPGRCARTPKNPVRPAP